MSWRDRLRLGRGGVAKHPPYDHPTEFYDVELEEISLVDQGDNPGAKVVFFKSSRAPQDFEAIVDEEIRKAQTAEGTPEIVPGNDGPPVTEATTRRSITMNFTKRSDVLEEATRQARVLMAAEPGRYPNEAAARAEIWERRPDLVKSYYELPDEPATPEPSVVEKTAAESPAFAEIQAEAERLVRESGYTLSESEARLRVSKARPDLYRRYELEKRAARNR